VTVARFEKFSGLKIVQNAETAICRRLGCDRRLHLSDILEQETVFLREDLKR
jgi:hypothetical protein